MHSTGGFRILLVCIFVWLCLIGGSHSVVLRIVVLRHIELEYVGEVGVVVSWGVDV